MRPGKRFGLSAIEKSDIWRRWKARNSRLNGIRKERPLQGCARVAYFFRRIRDSKTAACGPRLGVVPFSGLYPHTRQRAAKLGSAWT
jgi:hypothetical protein